MVTLNRLAYRFQPFRFQPFSFPFSSPPQSLQWLMGLGIAVFFLSSSTRHGLFHSGSLDLAYFDQATYLISRGEVPIVSFWGYHFLGGHADWILYVVAILYRIYPTVYWLLGIQAICLGLAPWPTWALARHAGLNQSQAVIVAAATLLYPLLFNLNLSDFHPEVIAFPIMLAAILAARTHQIAWFGIAVVVVLGCRDALSLTIIAMGVWLWLWERRQLCGAIAITTGTAWFLIATKLVIPAFRPDGVESVSRYAYLGTSLPEIISHIFLKPWLWLAHIFSVGTLEYIFLLFIPLAWGLSWRHCAPLVSAVPQLAMNLLAETDLMRNLVHQYALPILPFLILTVIATIADGKGLIPANHWVWPWAIICFLAMAKYDHFGGTYLRYLDTWQARREAIAQISPDRGSVLTTHEMIPHLSHRRFIYQIAPHQPINFYKTVDYVLISQDYAGFPDYPNLANNSIKRVSRDRQFQLLYQRDGVFLWVHHRYKQDMAN